MPIRSLDRDKSQIVMHAEGPLCQTTQEVVESEAFVRVVEAYARTLAAHRSPLLAELGFDLGGKAGRRALIDLLRVLANNPLERIPAAWDDPATLTGRREALHAFAEGLYDYWRSFDRFIVSHGEAGGGARDRRPHHTFNQAVETFASLVRQLYRDIVENITGDHPRVYRQVSAGCDVGIVAVRREWPAPERCRVLLGDIPFARHILINPPLIIDPPTNVRSGRFVEVADDPLDGMQLDSAKWICYPAVVGPFIVFVYVHQQFIGLGSSLANLFELASDAQLAAGPDALCVFGAPPEALARFGDLPTVYHESPENGLLVAAVPGEDRFGYFGYLKKMVLTLHNVVAMRHGRMPFHGAYTRIVLDDGAAANVLIIGDTAAGKSETLEALRALAGDEVSDLRIIADDMGSLLVESDGTVRGYGTEIGAFVRLDDLSKGYAFQQIDRAIFMSPHKVNARVVVPVTTVEEVLHGYPVDVLLYANNYERVDESHPVVERFETAERALAVFREGRAMSKGTTTSAGLTSSYFANIFGAAQRRDEHEAIAARVFGAAFAAGVYVGQLRTQLGVEGYSATGPQEAAVALLRLVESRHRQGQKEGE